MNKPDTEIKRWGIVMIQSLKTSDKKTGEELYHDILQYKRYYQSEAFSLFYSVASLEDLKLAIQNVLENIQDGDIVTLHFETHGHEGGIALSNGEIVSWRVFYDLIRPINIQIGHLLFVVMSQYEAIGFLIAAKSILRFNEASSGSEKSEYVLTGTLLSLAIALALGIFTLKI